jgi:hypothetical protein
MSDLKLGGATFPSPEDPTQKSPAPSPSKKSGLGCALIGCFTLMLLIASPFIGGIIYLKSMDETDYGHVIVALMHQDWFKEIITETVKNDSEKSAAEKQSFEEGYNKFLSNYDTLSAEKKEQIDTVLGKLFKKILEGGAGMTPELQKELEEAFGMMGLDASVLTAPTDRAATATTTPSTTDPFSFDLPAGTVPQPPTDTAQPSKYDF